MSNITSLLNTTENRLLDFIQIFHEGIFIGFLFCLRMCSGSKGLTHSIHIFDLGVEELENFKNIKISF